MTPTPSTRQLPLILLPGPFLHPQMGQKAEEPELVLLLSALLGALIPPRCVTLSAQALQSFDLFLYINSGDSSRQQRGTFPVKPGQPVDGIEGYAAGIRAILPLVLRQTGQPATLRLAMRPWQSLQMISSHQIQANPPVQGVPHSAELDHMAEDVKGQSPQSWSLLAGFSALSCQIMGVKKSGFYLSFSMDFLSDPGMVA